MLSHFGIAVITFMVTNVDDLLILSVYFANDDYKPEQIIAGQYLGIIILIGVSLSGLILGAFLADQWISGLGIIPFGLGIKGLLEFFRNQKGESKTIPSAGTFPFLSVALVTIANGGDNVGVYAPLFANLDWRYTIVYILVFLSLTAMWCLLAWYFVRRPGIRRIVSRYGKIILPVFLLLLGLYLMDDFGHWLLSNF